MRHVVLLGLLIPLAACSGDPSSFGITGPGSAPPPLSNPAANDPDGTPAPGIPSSGTSYGPSNAPSSGASGFFGYN